MYATLILALALAACGDGVDFAPAGTSGVAAELCVLTNGPTQEACLKVANVSFGTVHPDDEAQAWVRVTNVGNGPVTLREAALDAPGLDIMVFRAQMSVGKVKSLTSTSLPALLSSGQAFILRLTLPLGTPEGPIAPTTLSLSFADDGGNVTSVSLGILGAVSLCEAPMDDCDENPLNGCETELLTSVENCGVCGNACVTAHGAGMCVDGACVFSCDDGYTGPDCAAKVISCADGVLNCGQNASCVISQGAPTCLCDTHFQGDGQNCNPICGDGVMVGSEVCDDGNSREGDGCRYDCAGLEICGDGLFDPAADEACDDGNMNTGDGCDDRCELEPFEGPCGDGVLNLGEECDDSNNVSGDGCNECVLMMTDAWTCDPQVFKAGDGCDCGCGQVDPDCEDDTAESCDFCGGQGTCNPQDPACQLIEPASNFQCK